MRGSFVGLCGLLASLTAFGADIDAGRALATTCTACHGANGVSTAENIPNLAGQKIAYLQAQLGAFRAGDRKNPLMNAIAAQLDDVKIENLTAYFNSLASPGKSEASELGTMLGNAGITFPVHYKDSFTVYSTINQSKLKRVRYNYVNATGLAGPDANGKLPDNTFVVTEIYAAKLDPQGEPISGQDGNYVADKLLALAAMEKQPGYGEKVPELLRNGDWAYAFFTPDQQPKQGVNQAGCLACHKPLDDADYLFSYQQLVAAKQ